MKRSAITKASNDTSSNSQTRQSDLLSARSNLISYQIRIKGHIEERWIRWFEDLEVVPSSDGTTLILGKMDQAALHAILNRIRDLGVELISVIS